MPLLQLLTIYSPIDRWRAGLMKEPQQFFDILLHRFQRSPFLFRLYTDITARSGILLNQSGLESVVVDGVSQMSDAPSK